MLKYSYGAFCTANDKRPKDDRNCGRSDMHNASSYLYIGLTVSVFEPVDFFVDHPLPFQHCFLLGFLFRTESTGGSQA